MRSSVILPYAVGFILGSSTALFWLSVVERKLKLPVDRSEFCVLLLNILLASLAIASPYVRVVP